MNFNQINYLYTRWKPGIISIHYFNNNIIISKMEICKIEKNLVYFNWYKGDVEYCFNIHDFKNYKIADIV